MNLHLEGRRALITGASKGIGRAVAEILSAEGCELLMAARGLETLEEVASLIRLRSPRPVSCISADLSDERDRFRLVDWAGDVDILVNNAGAIPSGNLYSITSDAWRAAWELKVFGYVSLCRQIYLGMARRRTGVIINIIGVAGERPDPEYIAGSMGNAGLMAFTRALGKASPRDFVRVVGINPGITATSRAQSLFGSAANAPTIDKWLAIEANLPFGRAAKASEIAAAVAFLASDQSGYTSGTILTIDGGGAE
jgi:NAD(P)-dependent dehydrogenase (short-subunit alcohol dehydrogenase family)